MCATYLEQQRGLERGRDLGGGVVVALGVVVVVGVDAAVRRVDQRARKVAVVHAHDVARRAVDREPREREP